jgi:hypothetical protein
VSRILEQRKNTRIKNLDAVGRRTLRLKKANEYLHF